MTGSGKGKRVAKRTFERVETVGMSIIDKAFWTLGVIGGLCGGMLAQAEVIDVDVAQSVAEEQVARSFPDETWVCVDRADVDNVDGATASYAFFFAVAGSAWTTPDALQTAVLAGEPFDDGESPLYANTATILTGANDTDSLVFRHFRGLPAWWAENLRAEAGGLEASTVMMSPGDFRPVQTTPAAQKRGIRGWFKNRQDTSKWTALKEEKAARKARRAEQEASMDENWQKQAQEGQKEAENAKKSRWETKKAHVKAQKAAKTAAKGGDQ